MWCWAMDVYPIGHKQSYGFISIHLQMQQVLLVLLQCFASWFGHAVKLEVPSCNYTKLKTIGCLYLELQLGTSSFTVPTNLLSTVLCITESMHMEAC